MRTHAMRFAAPGLLLAALGGGCSDGATSGGRDNAALGSDGGGADGGSASPGETDGAVSGGDLRWSSMPECLALAEDLRSLIGEHRACSADADCGFALVQTLPCALPDLMDGDACPSYVAVQRSFDASALDRRGADLAECLRRRSEDAGVTNGPPTVEGRLCVPGCAAEPRVRCLAGRCESVPWSDDPAGAAP